MLKSKTVGFVNLFLQRIFARVPIFSGLKLVYTFADLILAQCISEKFAAALIYAKTVKFLFNLHILLHIYSNNTQLQHK